MCIEKLVENRNGDISCNLMIQVKVSHIVAGKQMLNVISQRYIQKPSVQCLPSTIPVVYVFTLLVKSQK